MTDQGRLILSAEALRIPRAEHRALLEIREHFAAGTFHHDPRNDADRPDGFNMNGAEHESECGTTCCIGGWVWRSMDRDRTTKSPTASRYVHHDCATALHPLYFPSFDDIDDMAYDDITPGAALVAIDSFIATGDPDWRGACGLDTRVIEVRSYRD
ncbi:hypothetical protein [Bradyrhizobium sp. th.b2]|uniref:hypothetical protein n=1 Tax=Bradyrhizobium sp. th-b2 TaxID=172088 RepID=UPI00048EEC56|nr:hypothetical protein [Bradyrhizobium sp. th.b2]